ncbi:hypothetical protein BJY52DRAFT_1200234 [Lactarius psammicola]|nr:hypothetical protein BJY52DRAFT_1200234 [Lactarius psammicola]
MYNDDYLDDSDIFDLQISLSQIPPCSDSHFDGEGEDDTVGTQREPILAVGVPVVDATTRSTSRISGSTLHSGLGHSAAHSFPHKTPLFPRPSIDVIASLTISELCYNPHYIKLREEFDHVSSSLAMCIERGFSQHPEPPTATSDTLVPDIYQALSLRGADSCASSLGPSDSASQQMKVDYALDKAIENLLECVEAPSVQPQFLPASVLWYYEDCKKDKPQTRTLKIKNLLIDSLVLAAPDGNWFFSLSPPLPLSWSGTPSAFELTRTLKSLHRADGSKISSQEFANVRHSADIIVQKLLDLVDSDPRVASRPGVSKSRTKSFVKNLYKAEYRQAILDLEVEQRLLRLCSAHWKADNMIGQAFLRQSDAETKAASNCMRAASMMPDRPGLSDAKGSQPSEPLPTAPIQQVWDVGSMNVAKRALELSPGPKSPSVLHAQKCSKDDAVLSRQKTTGPPVPSSHLRRHPVASKLAPTFLNRHEVITVEPASMNLRPVFVDPSADNLVALLTSDFPSLTNAPGLIHSMNAQSSFKQGKTSEKVTTLLKRIQSADLGSPDIDEDDVCQGWGHYQFTAGGLTLSSSLATWEDIGSVATALKLVAAALKTCQEARLMCTNAGTPKTDGFISDVYLKKMIECLENCWVGTGGTITSFSCNPVIPTTPPSYRDIAMSPPRRGFTIKFKQPTPNTDVMAAASALEEPTGTNSTTNSQQPVASTEHAQEPPSDKGTRADLASLKLLQVSELLTWISDNKLNVPKSKRKDDLIAVIINSPKFAQVPKSSIQEIIDNRKPKKGPKKQLAAL